MTALAFLAIITAAAVRVTWLLQDEPKQTLPPWPVKPYGYTKPVSNRPFTFGEER